MRALGQYISAFTVVCKRVPACYVTDINGYFNILIFSGLDKYGIFFLPHVTGFARLFKSSKLYCALLYLTRFIDLTVRSLRPNLYDVFACNVSGVCYTYGKRISAVAVIFGLSDELLIKRRVRQAVPESITHGI